MKTNIFSVRKKTDDKILIEEEKTKNPFLLFLKRHRKLLLWLLFLLFVSTLLISVGIAFSLFQNTEDIDISFLNENKDKVVANTDIKDDEEAKEELLGAVARKEGVVLLVKTFMTSNNDVVYYFSDYTSIIVTANGKIYRVSSINNGTQYGIDNDGNIDKNAKKVLVKSTTSTLENGTIITYYSDGSAKLEHNGATLFVRDSNNIKIESGNIYKFINPSGVASNNGLVKDGNKSMITYTDNTKFVKENDTKLIVNPKANATNKDNNITYDKNNTFKVLEEKKMTDGTTVTYFENGSAVITDKNNNSTFVKKSGDIVIKNNNIYEIITNKYGFSKKTFPTGDGKKITYFDNGAAIIEYPNGIKTYVADSNEILYDSNKNITSKPDEVKQIGTQKTTDGYKVINFDNGKSQVIKPDGSSFIIDTSKLIFDNKGAITDSNKKDDTKTTGSTSSTTNNNKTTTKKDSSTTKIIEDDEDPLEGLYVSDAEYKYEDDTKKNKQNTSFIIKNDNKKQKKIRIVIEEIDNYLKYNVKRLEPKYVKYQATIGDNLVGPAMLNDNTWSDENGKVNYVIYDGVVPAKSELDVTVTLYLDYSILYNSEQDKTFMGTVKVYVTK